MLVFLTLWLILFRKEVRFPQGLLLVPVGVGLLLALNVVRIAVLILIGHVGFRNIAAEGFHSEAGWILFNAVAFAIAVGARRVPWIVRAPRQAERRSAVGKDGTAAYLMPFLAALAAAMLARAVSGGFEWWYALRLAGAAAMLWAFRKEYGQAAIWRWNWIAPATGIAVFALWLATAKILPWEPRPERMPMELAHAAVAWRFVWILFRLLTAVIFVPIAEELAFRGYLMRWLAGERFESAPVSRVPVWAVAASSLLFGLLHGARGFEATLAGGAYAWAYRKRGNLGDAIVAHAITNLMVGVYVLGWGDWSFW